MRRFVTHWLWSGVALAAAMAIGGCGGANVSAGAISAANAPLSRSIQAFFHAFSVEQIQCGSPDGQGRRSCQVEFTDTYGQWWATIIVRGSTVISDPGGVADWLCADACANPPGMTANTGNPKQNPGSTGSTGSGFKGQTGVTGIGGVVKITKPKPKPKPVPVPESVTGPNGVVPGTGSTGVVSGNTGVVKGSGNTGVVSGSGNTGKTGATGDTGVVYGTGSTGPGG